MAGTLIQATRRAKGHEEIPLGGINTRGKSLGALRKAQTQQVCACNLVMCIPLSRYIWNAHLPGMCGGFCTLHRSMKEL